MQIRMLRAFRAWQVGEEIELPHEAATAWVEYGVAEQINPPTIEELPVPVVVEVEAGEQTEPVQAPRGRRR